MQSGRRHAVTSAPGDLIGEYRIEGVLGEGAMGTVYAAVHSVIDKRVALKVLRRELCTNPDFIARFVKEARVVNRIGHPNIVDVFGFGTTDDGRAFLAMELLEGGSLAARLAAEPIEIPEVCDIAIEIAHALEAAHKAGIVHRDLKPENVFLAPVRGRPVVKLLDFGIAKLTGPGASLNPTQPGTLMGTPTYIAPEQARGDEIDGRVDIYALGVMLFEMLVGRPPFEASNALELASMQITERPPTPSSLAPGLSRKVDQLVGAMLEKSAANRPTLVAIRRALDELRVESGAGRSNLHTPIPTRRAATDDPSSTAASLAAIKARRWPMFVLGLLVLVLGFGIVVALGPYVMNR